MSWSSTNLQGHTIQSDCACPAGDYVKTKRALIRAVEKQAEMSEKMDLLKAELDVLDRSGGGDASAAAATTAAHSGGFGGGGFGAGDNFSDQACRLSSGLPLVIMLHRGYTEKLAVCGSKRRTWYVGFVSLTRSVSFTNLPV